MPVSLHSASHNAPSLWNLGPTPIVVEEERIGGIAVGGLVLRTAGADGADGADAVEPEVAHLEARGDLDDEYLCAFDYVDLAKIVRLWENTTVLMAFLLANTTRRMPKTTRRMPKTLVETRLIQNNCGTSR